MTKQEMEDLARRLAAGEGQKELEQRLRDMANPKQTTEGQREGALDDAERGLAEAERGLGGMPLPVPGESPSPGQGGPQGPTSGDGQHGGPGSRNDSVTGM